MGLAADGFNPFGNMSLLYNMWPVVLKTYNLPLWICMKPEYLMLTLLILGLQFPEKDMEVFLRPSIDELNELWVNGLETHDAASDNSVFRMWDVLLWTVNDFSTRSSLSRWSGQGYRACPTCNEDTPSMRIIRKQLILVIVISWQPIITGGVTFSLMAAQSESILHANSVRWT